MDLELVMHKEASVVGPVSGFDDSVMIMSRLQSGEEHSRTHFQHRGYH